MAKVIDSKKQQLTLQDVMLYRVYDEHAEGKLKHDPAVVLLTLVKELEMPRSEAILFGNSLFISHYNESGTGAVVRMLNVDTAKNVMENGEKFYRHLQNRGVTHFIAQYSYKNYMRIFEKFEKMHFGTAVTKDLGNNNYVTCVTLAKSGGK